MSENWEELRSDRRRKLICYIDRKRGLLKYETRDDFAIVDLFDELGIMPPKRHTSSPTKKGEPGVRGD